MNKIIQIIPDEESNALWIVYQDRLDFLALDTHAILLGYAARQARGAGTQSGSWKKY